MGHGRGVRCAGRINALCLQPTDAMVPIMSVSGWTLQSRLEVKSSSDQRYRCRRAATLNYIHIEPFTAICASGPRDTRPVR